MAIPPGKVAPPATYEFNTSNRGIDIVFDYKKRWDNSHFNVLLAGNIQALKINKINIPATFRHSASDSATFFLIGNSIS